MYKQIINPENGNYVSIYVREGFDILKQYIKQVMVLN